MSRIDVWSIEQSKILTRREQACVLKKLSVKAKRSINARLSLVVVRLACCCGLRVSEIAGLCLEDVQTNVSRPRLRVRAELAKGRRARLVPLWWAAGTLEDIQTWKVERIAQVARAGDRFVCSMQGDKRGRALSRHALRQRFLSACKALGPERIRHLTIPHGRHTFISHALAGGRTLAEMRHAAGHVNVIVTSADLHLAVDDDGEVGRLFRSAQA